MREEEKYCEEEENMGIIKKKQKNKWRTEELRERKEGGREKRAGSEKIGGKNAQLERTPNERGRRAGRSKDQEWREGKENNGEEGLQKGEDQ